MTKRLEQIVSDHPELDLPSVTIAKVVEVLVLAGQKSLARQLSRLDSKNQPAFTVPYIIEASEEALSQKGIDHSDITSIETAVIGLALGKQE